MGGTCHRGARVPVRLCTSLSYGCGRRCETGNRTELRRRNDHRNLPGSSAQLVVSSRKKRQNKQTELAESENLDGCDLTSIDLSRTSMRNKPMYRATLSEVTAFNADFHGAELVLARLNRGTFGGASFRQADLKGASCVDADFRGADFVGAHCRSINLRRADLRDATMGDIDLTKARLQGADFRGCVLDDACVKGARYDRRTRFPEGFDPVSSGMRETPDER
jgi:uncharacterized protein YjbI with pentapeptide repeats